MESKTVRLMTVSDVIDRLNLHDRPNPEGAIRWMIRTGKLNPVRLGRGIVRFRPEDIEALIDQAG